LGSKQLDFKNRIPFSSASVSFSLVKESMAVVPIAIDPLTIVAPASESSVWLPMSIPASIPARLPILMILARSIDSETWRLAAWAISWPIIPANSSTESRAVIKPLYIKIFAPGPANALKMSWFTI